MVTPAYPFEAEHSCPAGRSVFSVLSIQKCIHGCCRYCYRIPEKTEKGLPLAAGLGDGAIDCLSVTSASKPEAVSRMGAFFLIEHGEIRKTTPGVWVEHKVLSNSLSLFCFAKTAPVTSGRLLFFVWFYETYSEYT